MSTSTNQTQHPALRGMHTSIVGIVANGLLAIIKGLTGYWGHSYALIADAIESTLDIFSSLVVWWGLKIATVPPDKNHPYGHGKAEPLAAMIVSGGLFGAALLIAYNSVREIFIPHHTPEAYTLFVLIGVIVTKEILFRFVFKTGKEVDSIAVKTDAWHHRSDALTSLAAFIGISIALIGGKAYACADDWAALFASFIIGFNSFRLFRPTLDELMDAAPLTGIREEVLKIAQKVEGVVRLDKCYVRKMGFDFYVDLHVMVDPMISVDQGHAIAHNVKDAIQSSNPRIADVITHIEPAV